MTLAPSEALARRALAERRLLLALHRGLSLITRALGAYLDETRPGGHDGEETHRGAGPPARTAGRPRA